MNKTPKLIVMLTHNDQTVENAYEVFDKNKDSDAQLWGFKEKPLPVSEMKQLYSYMKKCGKTTVLEVVEYDKEKCLEGAKLAVQCKCDILMGTMFSDEILNLCLENNIKYMPFVGDVKERPSVLHGSIDSMIDEAKNYISKGAYGVDLLGYRYVNDPVELIKKLNSEVDAPICVAGSINSYPRLDEIKNVSPWAFTIGSAFFENNFTGTFQEQINKVSQYLEN